MCVALVDISTASHQPVSNVQVLEIVNRFGQFSLQDLADSNMAVVLDTWLDILQRQLAPMVALDDDLFSQSQLIPVADKQQWVPANVWFGLKVLLGLLEVSWVDGPCKHVC